MTKQDETAHTTGSCAFIAAMLHIFTNCASCFREYHLRFSSYTVHKYLTYATKTKTNVSESRPSTQLKFLDDIFPQPKHNLYFCSRRIWATFSFSKGTCPQQLSSLKFIKTDTSQGEFRWEIPHQRGPHQLCCKFLFQSA